jgi:hypothetical protein
LGPTNGTGPSSSCHPHKRKGSSAEDAEEGVCGDGKRIRGLGSGVHDGPISFSDVQQLQRANDELQEELKAHVLTIEKLQSEYHLAEDRHALVGFLPALRLTFSIGMWSLLYNFQFCCLNNLEIW